MKVIKLKESDIQRIVKKVIKEDSDDKSWEKRWEDNRLYGFSNKTLIGALMHMMKIAPYDLDRIEELKNLSKEELVAKLIELKGWWFITHDHNDYRNENNNYPYTKNNPSTVNIYIETHKEMKVIKLNESDIKRIVKRVLNESEFKPTDVTVTHKETNHYKLSDTDGFNNLKIGNNISDSENHYKGGESNKVYGTVNDNSIQFDFDSKVSDGSNVTDVKVKFTNTLKQKKGTIYEVELIVTYKNSGVRSISSARTNITISNLPKGYYQLSNNIDDNNWLSFNVN